MSGSLKQRIAKQMENRTQLDNNTNKDDKTNNKQLANKQTSKLNYKTKKNKSRSSRTWTMIGRLTRKKLFFNENHNTDSGSTNNNIIKPKIDITRTACT